MGTMMITCSLYLSIIRIKGYLSSHIGAPLVTNMDEGKGGEANGSEPPMSLRRLLVGIFWNPIGIQFGIAIIAVSIGFTLKLVGWL
jgi:hypothetical protein